MYTVLVELGVQKKNTEKEFKRQYKKEVNQWFINYASFNTKKMNLTTKKILLSFINTELSEGNSYKQIATNLRNKRLKANIVRAKLASKTIAHSAMNYTLDSIIGFLQLNFEAEWVCSKKEHGRRGFSHKNANGERVVHGDKFKMTGEDLLFPGDPNGNITNIAGCSCVLCYHLIPKALSNRRRIN
jgi:hypothetical protein